MEEKEDIRKNINRQTEEFYGKREVRHSMKLKEETGNKRKKRNYSQIILLAVLYAVLIMFARREEYGHRMSWSDILITIVPLAIVIGVFAVVGIDRQFNFLSQAMHHSHRKEHDEEDD